MSLKRSHHNLDNAFTATKKFTDRDASRKLFLQALERQVSANDYQVLTFYGVGGQGKTALCNEFLRMLDRKSVV